MKVWVTKYALMQGIFVMDVERCAGSDKMVSATGEDYRGVSVHKPHWHESRVEAVKQALAMRVDRRDAIARELERLEALDFSQDVDG